MKNFLIAFAVFLIWSVFGIWLYSRLGPQPIAVATPIEEADVGDPDQQTDTTAEKHILPESADTNSLIKESAFKAVTPDNAIIFLFPEGISISKNSAEVFISKSVTDFKYHLNTYFTEHPDEELHINSLYSAGENIATPNLGVQRGNKIKEILEETGIPGNKILVKPVIKEINFDEKGRYHNSISFAFKPLDKERVAALENEMLPAMVIYPTFSNSGVVANVKLEKFLREVQKIVEEKPDITIEIIGHTDSIGNAEDNYKTALGYAHQLRGYLIAKGNIDKDRIIASSKGEASPLDTNNTEQGRRANRRIEVIFY